MSKEKKELWSKEKTEFCVSEWNGVLTKHYFDERPDEIIQLEQDKSHQNYQNP